MSKKQDKQVTETGFEIPVPKRGDFFDNLKKAATPQKESTKRGPKKKQREP